jgi:hypothetical protein
MLYFVLRHFDRVFAQLQEMFALWRTGQLPPPVLTTETKTHPTRRQAKTAPRRVRARLRARIRARIRARAAQRRGAARAKPAYATATATPTPRPQTAVRRFAPIPQWPPRATKCA